jgi:TetR/AcrR family transcriptional regulator, tetracycline repressor protein
MTETERPRLSKAAVVERGLALADAEGLEAVTIRRLAADLGVTPMALYWHFRSKDELLVGLAERVWAEIDVDVDTDADWAAQLRFLLESLIHVLRTHPSASQLLLSGEKRTSESAMIANEVALEVLSRAGFDAEHAAAIAKNALFTGLMLVVSGPGFEPGLTDAERIEHQRLARVRLSLLPPDKFPRLVECAVPMTASDNPDFHYKLGIDLFVAGVQALAAKDGSANGA